MASANDADRRAGARQMLSLRTRWIYMSIIVQSVSSGLELDGVLGRIHHRSPRGRGSEAVTACYIAFLASVSVFPLFIVPSDCCVKRVVIAECGGSFRTGLVSDVGRQRVVAVE